MLEYALEYLKGESRMARPKVRTDNIRRCLLKLTPENLRCITLIQQEYGFTTFAAAIRWALNRTAKQIEDGK